MNYKILTFTTLVGGIIANTLSVNSRCVGFDQSIDKDRIFPDRGETMDNIVVGSLSGLLIGNLYCNKPRLFPSLIIMSCMAIYYPIHYSLNKWKPIRMKGDPYWFQKSTNRY